MNSDDLNNYKKFLIGTSAQKRNYNSSESIRFDKSFKYKNIMARFLSIRRRRKKDDQPMVNHKKVIQTMVSHYKDDPSVVWIHFLTS